MIDIKILDLDNEDDKAIYKLQNQASDMYSLLRDINEFFYKNDKLDKDKYQSLIEGLEISFDI
jgi:hypothetical protein